MMMFVGREGLHGVKKCFDYVGLKFFGLLLLWFDCVARLGCVF